MCYVFDKRHRYLLVDSDSIEELEKMFFEFEKTDEVCMEKVCLMILKVESLK